MWINTLFNNDFRWEISFHNRAIEIGFLIHLDIYIVDLDIMTQSFRYTRVSLDIVTYLLFWSRVCQLSRVWDRLVKRVKGQRKRKKTDGERSKIILSFTRRYLASQKPYRDE